MANKKLKLRHHCKTPNKVRSLLIRYGILFALVYIFYRFRHALMDKLFWSEDYVLSNLDLEINWIPGPLETVYKFNLDITDQELRVVENIEHAEHDPKLRRRVRCLQTKYFMESCSVCKDLNSETECFADSSQLGFSYVQSATLISTIADMQARRRGGFSLDQQSKGLVLGLGGGSLPNYLANRFKNLDIDVVELNAVTATQVLPHIGVSPIPKNLYIHIDDGRSYVEEHFKKHLGDLDSYSFIFVDICVSGDNEGCGKFNADHQGCCPPAAFKTSAYLTQIIKLLSFETSEFSGVYGVHTWKNPLVHSQLVLKQLQRTLDHVFQVAGDRDAMSSIYFGYNGPTQYSIDDIIDHMSKYEMYSELNHRQLAHRLLKNSTAWQ